MTLLAAGARASTSAWDQPGTLGFLVVFGMAVILYFVFRSMSRHLKKVSAAAAAEAKLQAAPASNDARAEDMKLDAPADGRLSDRPRITAPGPAADSRPWALPQSVRRAADHRSRRVGAARLLAS